jgi:hypothetical protein
MAAVTTTEDAIRAATGTVATGTSSGGGLTVGNASVGELPSVTILAPGFSYAITGQDYLTMARSIDRESPADCAAILWTYVQRYVALRGPAGPYPTLSRMVIAFSQPINPLWFPDGPKCRPGGPYYGQRECANAEMRPIYASRPWGEIRSSVRDGILRWAQGRVANSVPRSINFASSELIRRQLAAGNTAQREIVYDGENTFVSEPVSRAWPSDSYVRIQANGRIVSAQDGLSGGELTAILLGGALVLGAGYAAFKNGLVSKVTRKFR